METFLIRILVCFILSIIIGIERQFRHRVVGLRTNVLVCLGAFLFVYLSYNVSVSDQTRVAAQVVSGIGFLGAGIIIRDGDKIKGLNTAATLWCVSAIGVLCASGLLIEASVGTLLVLISNLILRLVSQFIMNKMKENAKEKYTINITCLKDKEKYIKEKIIKLIQGNSLLLRSLERNEITSNEIKFKVITITSTISKIEYVINKISMESGVTAMSWEHEPYNKQDNQDSEEE